MTDMITNIDGKKYTVKDCFDCPFYDGGDGGYGDHCQYPESPSECPNEYCDGPPDDCPLRKNQTKSNKVNLILKPCPFCGANAVLAVHHTNPDTYDGAEWWVVCPKCHIKTSRSLNEDEPVELWNRRVEK